jgi:sulfur carrier protein ThiS
MADLMKNDVRVIGYDDPISNNAVEAFVQGGQTIAEAFPQLSSQIAVTINGNPVLEEQYDERVLTADDLVTMVRMPAGTVDEGKRLGRQALILSLQITAAAATGGQSAWIQTAAQAGAVYGGNKLADAVGLIPTPDIRKNQSDEDLFDRRRALTGSRNRLAPWAHVPRVYGHMRVFPPMAAKPYTTVNNNVQYLHLLFNLGSGPLELGEPKKGNTNIGTFKAA